MARKNIVLFFEYFSSIHFNKDPFLVPYYLGKLMNYDVSILYPILSEKDILPQEHRNVKLLPFYRKGNSASPYSEQYQDVLQYIKENAKEIHVLMLFFGSDISKLFMKIYRKYNPDGKIYIKLDIDPYTIKRRKDAPLWKRIYSWARCAFWRRPFLWTADVVSCETRMAYELLIENIQPSNWTNNVLTYVPNGIDNEELAELGYDKPCNNSEKEKIILTVGRLGTYQKNTEMILDALEKINLKDWKFYFVGSVEEGFENVVSQYMLRHPEWKERVIWTGPLSERFSLYDLYKHATVFVLSSRYESYGIVYTEAKFFADYIITTPVGACEDIIENGKYGEIVSIEDAEELASALNAIITKKTNMTMISEAERKKLSWEYCLKEVAEKLKK